MASHWEGCEHVGQHRVEISRPGMPLRILKIQSLVVFISGPALVSASQAALQILFWLFHEAKEEVVPSKHSLWSRGRVVCISGAGDSWLTRQTLRALSPAPEEKLHAGADVIFEAFPNPQNIFDNKKQVTLLSKINVVHSVTKRGQRRWNAPQEAPPTKCFREISLGS